MSLANVKSSTSHYTREPASRRLVSRTLWTTRSTTRTSQKDVLFDVGNKKYNLIETVATDAARICVARYGITTVKVTVEKPNALRFAESSSVTIERCWEDFKWHD